MFKSDNQNFWQLMSIQSVALGLPAFLIGNQLTSKIGFGKTLTSLILGNIILWLVALTMFAMTYTPKNKAEHTIQSVSAYLGKSSSLIASIVLFIAFETWYPIQINTQMKAIDGLLSLLPDWQRASSVRYGIFFACVTALISMGGIKAIKWVCTIAFPVFLTYVLYAVVKDFSSISFKYVEWGLSFMGVFTIVIVLLPGIVNLPTFFRHARSRADGLFALSLMTIFVIIFQFAGIWCQISPQPSGIFAPYNPNTGFTLHLILALSFVTSITVCVNLLNIYFASAVIESISPNFADPIGYGVIGLIGTTLYGLIQVASVLEYVENLSTLFISCLGLTLLLGYLITLVTRHRPRIFQKSMNSISWLVGSIAATIAYSISYNLNKGLITGFLAGACSFLLAMYVEETMWAYKKSSLRKSIKKTF